MIPRLKAFFAFWYDFVVGDDWRVAVGVVIALALFDSGLVDLAGGRCCSAAADPVARGPRAVIRPADRRAMTGRPGPGWAGQAMYLAGSVRISRVCLRCVAVS